MSSSGPNSPGTSADDSSIGGALSIWSNPNNSQASDNSYATCILTGGTHYLKNTNFGFSIPSGATIDGIVVEIERHDNSGGLGTTKDNAVRIVKGGTIGSTDKSTGTDWAATDPNTYVSYGGVSDLWGETWTDSDINSSGFGTALSAQQGSGGPGGASCDHVRVTVHYTASSATQPVRTMHQARQRRT